MDWFSDMGRRLLKAYTDGLTMSCPVYRIVCEDETKAAASPCHIDMRQHDVEVFLQQSVTVRH